MLLKETVFLAIFSLVACACTPSPNAEIIHQGEALTSLEIPEGAWREFSVSEGEVVELKHSDEIVGFIEGERFSLRPQYQSASSTVTVSVQSGGVVQDIELEVEVILGEWRSLKVQDDASIDMPPEREYFTWWKHPVEEKLLLVGGFHYRPQQFTASNDAWSYDLASDAWTPLADVGLPLHAGAAVAQREGEVFMFGGVNDPGNGERELPFQLFKWNENEGTFDDVLPEGAPANGRYQPAFFYVESIDAFVAVGGLGRFGVTMQIESYDPTLNEWSVMSARNEGPRGRNGFFWGFSKAQERLYIFGGDQNPSNFCDECAGDTWVLDFKESPPTWREIVQSGPTPEARRNGLYAIDEKEERLLIFGGTPDGRNSGLGFWALDLKNGRERWDLIREADNQTLDAPWVRSSGGAIIDAERSRMLLGFGNGRTVHNDLWEWVFDARQ